MFEARWAEGRPDDARRDFDIMFFSHPLPIWVYDLDTLRFLAVNPAAVARYGYSVQEFRARRIIDIRPPEDAHRLEQQIRAGRFPQRNERWRHKLKDGTMIDVDVTAHVTTFDGKPAVLALNVDRSDNTRLLRELRESEERFRLLSSLPEEYAFAVGIRPDRYELLWCTEWLEREWGFSAASVNDPAGPLAWFHREDRSTATQNLATLLAGESVEAVVHVVGADGRPRWGRYFCLPIVGDGGRVVRLVAAVHDITMQRQIQRELEEFESRYRQIFENSIVGVTRSTLAGTVVEANDAAARILGYSNLPELLEATSYDPLSIAHPADRERAFEALLRDGELHDFEIRVRHRGGEVRWIAISARLVEGAGGPLVDGTFVDVTDRKRVAEEAARRYQALVELDATRRTVLARLEAARYEERRRIARELHDQLGQKLTTASLLVSSIEGTKGQTAKTLSRLLEEALASTRELVASIRSDSEGGGLEPLLQTLAEEAGRAGVDVHLHVQGVGAPLESDAEVVLYRVAQEALTNVIKHAGARAASVVLTREPGGVLLLIEDDGRGFDPAQANEHAHFGLVGIRERAKEIGATIDIESARGSGTRIRLKLPTANMR